MRTTPGMYEFIKPVDDVIRLGFLPALLDSIVPEVEIFNPTRSRYVMVDWKFRYYPKSQNPNLKHHKL